jgi:hypothetical protein
MVNNLSKALERVHVIRLYIIRLFFPCGERSYNVALKYPRYWIRRENPEGMVKRTTRTSRAPDHKVSGHDVPTFHKICTKRNDKLPCGGFSWKRAENKIILVPNDIGL